MEPNKFTLFTNVNSSIYFFFLNSQMAPLGLKSRKKHGKDFFFWHFALIVEFSRFFCQSERKGKKWVSKRHAFKPKQINRIVCYWYRRQSTDIVRATMIYCRKVTKEERENREKRQWRVWNGMKSDIILNYKWNDLLDTMKFYRTNEIESK